MTAKQAEKELRIIIEEILRSYGFKRQRGLAFFRQHSDRTDRIGFSVFIDRTGKLRFSFGIGIRFPQIENLRANTEDSVDMPTIGIPMHFLQVSRTYFDWTLSDPIDAVEVMENVRAEIEARGLPFLEKFGSLETIRASLERDDAREWFTLDSEQRDELLALLDYLQKGKEAALQRLEAAIEKRINAPQKNRYPLENLRERLLKGVSECKTK